MKKAKVTSFFDKLYALPTLPVMNKVDNYLALSVSIVENNENLLFWKQHSFMWPRLASVACCYLGIPAASTSSERTFSLAGCTLENRRSQLASESVDDLLFIQGLR